MSKVSEIMQHVCKSKALCHQFLRFTEEHKIVQENQRIIYICTYHLSRNDSDNIQKVCMLLVFLETKLPETKILFRQ